MRRCLTLALVTAGLCAPMSALAQSANCPPGAWFCEDTEVPPPPAAAPREAPPVVVAPAPLPEPAPEPAAPAPARRGGVHVEAHAGASVSIGSAPPPVVVYQPLPSAPPPQVYIVTQPRVLVRPLPPPPTRYYMRRSEWGLNLRLEGAIMGRSQASNSGMGGVGLSLRYRPVPHFAIDFGIDVLGGKDWNGFDRSELPVSLSGLLYVNPRSRVQFYFMGGADWSHAKVRSDQASPLLSNGFGSTGFTADYSYFGGHGGIGLEFRLSRLVALNMDMIGFARKRTDGGTMPEFVDERGRTTNASGGGLFRGGITFWW